MSLKRLLALASIAVHSEQTPQRTNRFMQLPFFISVDGEYYCLLQKELRDEHERRTEDELSKQREYINLNPFG